jgi:autoinducer 2-degrading protein
VGEALLRAMVMPRPWHVGAVGSTAAIGYDAGLLNVDGMEIAMHVTLVHVHVKPEHVEDFIAATHRNHKHSVQEPGNLRFDILQSPDDPNHFILYEAYATEAGAMAHKATDHYLTWRNKVADWMATSRVGVHYHGLYPEVGQ